MGSWRLEPLYHRLWDWLLNLYQNMSGRGATRTSYTLNADTITVERTRLYRTVRAIYSHNVPRMCARPPSMEEPFSRSLSSFYVLELRGVNQLSKPVYY